MKTFYSDYFLETHNGERYVLPIAIDANDYEEAKIAAEGLLKAFPEKFKTAILQWGPRDDAGLFRDYIKMRIENWHGHVKAGRLTLSQFVASDVNDGSTDGLDVLPGTEGVLFVRLARSEHQSCSR
jgi:hypothetical protein